MADFVVPMTILLGVLGLMLWAIGERKTKRIDERLRVMEAERQKVPCLVAQAVEHERRINRLEMRTFAHSKELVHLANKISDVELDIRPTIVSPIPAPLLECTPPNP